ncbi:MAG: cellulase family glycosylhydrolase [Anaerolineae bacterium]
MSKFRLKLFIWLILGAISAAGFFFVIGRAANLLLYFQESADPASALNIVPNRPADLKVQLDWLPDDADTGRKIEPFTRTQIESAYLRAWLQWNISYLRGEPYGLETYFVGPALAAATEGVELTQLQGWSIQQTDLEHKLKLHMYSADGSIISMTAHNVKLAQIIRNYDGQPIMADVVEADYDVVMKLEDGSWRVRHWVRREKSEPFPEITAQIDPTLFATVEDQHLIVDGEPYTIRGVNYYPKDTPWHDFWPEYNPEIIEQDFAIMASLGINTIRIFVPYEPQLPEPDPHEAEDVEVGGAHPVTKGSAKNNKHEQIDPYEDLRLKLNNLLSQADDHDLKVIVTLFDFRTDYQILLWPNADRDLEKVVPYFADNPTILAWDLKNEPDLDQPGNTALTVNAWLTHIAQEVRDHAPNHLITIGWATSEGAKQLPEVVDFVSFHDYLPPETLPERIKSLRSAVPNKPIVLTEFGLPTWNSRFFPNGHTEREQAVYYADVRRVLNEANLNGYMAWTLYDFEGIPSSVVGRKPWKSGPQRHLGLIRDNGEKKWAAFLLAENSNLDIPRPPRILRFFKPFWQTVFMLLVASIIIGRNLKRKYFPAQA